jgi:hypothetical protein
VHRRGVGSRKKNACILIPSAVVGDSSNYIIVVDINEKGGRRYEKHNWIDLFGVVLRGRG